MCGAAILLGESSWRHNAKIHRRVLPDDDERAKKARVEALEFLSDHSSYRVYLFRTVLKYGVMIVPVCALALLVGHALSTSYPTLFITVIGFAINAPYWTRLEWQSNLIAAGRIEDAETAKQLG
jgi:hypothetical protein